MKKLILLFVAVAAFVVYQKANAVKATVDNAFVDPESESLTTLRPDSSEYHYGMVGKEETVRKVVRLSNIGKVPFHIKEVTTSCDCLSVEYDWDEILPGKDAMVTVSYKAETPGRFWRTITVYGNVLEGSVTLDFWGTVR